MQTESFPKSTPMLRRGRSAGRVLLGMALLVAFLAAGMGIEGTLGLSVPGNILGMVLLTGALAAGVIRLEWVEEAAGLMGTHLPLFLIPAAVGIIRCGAVLRKEWLAISASTLGSTLIVLAVTGWAVQAFGSGKETADELEQ